MGLDDWAELGKQQKKLQSRDPRDSNKIFKNATEERRANAQLNKDLRARGQLPNDGSQMASYTYDSRTEKDVKAQEHRALQPLRAMNAFNDTLGAAGGFIGKIPKSNVTPPSQQTTGQKVARVNPPSTPVVVKPKSKPKAQSNQSFTAPNPNTDRSIKPPLTPVKRPKFESYAGGPYLDMNNPVKPKSNVPDTDATQVAPPPKKLTREEQLGQRKKHNSGDYAVKSYQVRKGMGKDVDKELSKYDAAGNNIEANSKNKTQPLDQSKTPRKPNENPSRNEYIHSARDAGKDVKRQPNMVGIPLKNQPHPGQAEVKRNMQELQKKRQVIKKVHQEAITPEQKKAIIKKGDKQRANAAYRGRVKKLINEVPPKSAESLKQKVEKYKADKKVDDIRKRAAIRNTIKNQGVWDDAEVLAADHSGSRAAEWTPPKPKINSGKVTPTPMPRNSNRTTNNYNPVQGPDEAVNVKPDFSKPEFQGKSSNIRVRNRPGLEPVVPTFEEKYAKKYKNRNIFTEKQTEGYKTPEHIKKITDAADKTRRKVADTSTFPLSRQPGTHTKESIKDKQRRDRLTDYKPSTFYLNNDDPPEVVKEKTKTMLANEVDRYRTGRKFEQDSLSRKSKNFKEKIEQIERKKKEK